MTQVSKLFPIHGSLKTRILCLFQNHRSSPFRPFVSGEHHHLVNFPAAPVTILRHQTIHRIGILATHASSSSVSKLLSRGACPVQNRRYSSSSCRGIEGPAVLDTAKSGTFQTFCLLLSGYARQTVITASGVVCHASLRAFSRHFKPRR
jgi:hypothetical protein